MPVMQQIPQIQADISIANMINELGQIGGGIAQKLVDSRRQSGHNERVYQAAMETLNKIKSQVNISDDDFSRLSSQLAPKEKNDPNYEREVSVKLVPLALWGLSGAAKQGVPAPDLNIDPKTSINLLQSQMSQAGEAATRSQITGGGTLGGMQTPAQEADQAVRGTGVMAPSQSHGAGFLSNLEAATGGQPQAPSQQPQGNLDTSSFMSHPRVTLIPTDEGRTAAAQLMSDYQQGILDYKEFDKQYRDILKSASETAKEMKKARIEAGKELALKGNRPSSTPTGTFSAMDLENVQYSTEVQPVTTRQENVSYSYRQPTGQEKDMTETYHNQLYSEVQKREITSSKMVEKGEEPLKDGVPEIALAYFEQVPGTTPSQARSAARNVLPLYQTLSKMFGEDVISKGQLAQYIYVARKRGEDDNSITQAMFKMFGKNNEMQGR